MQEIKCVSCGCVLAILKDYTVKPTSPDIEEFKLSKPTDINCPSCNEVNKIY